jgi:hypothetical protein
MRGNSSGSALASRILGSSSATIGRRTIAPPRACAIGDLEASGQKTTRASTTHVIEARAESNRGEEPRYVTA